MVHNHADIFALLLMEFVHRVYPDEDGRPSNGWNLSPNKAGRDPFLNDLPRSRAVVLIVRSGQSIFF